MPVQKICTVAEAVRLNEYAYALTLERLGLGAVKRLCLCAVPLGGALIELEAGPQTSS